MVSAIITCAGSGSRAGFGKNKLLENVGGTTVFEKTVKAFDKPFIDEIIITYRPEDLSSFKEICEKIGVKALFARGGETRSESVLRGLEKATGDIVVVHDGARPFVTEKTIKDCVKSAEEYGSGIAAAPVTDTIANVSDGYVISSGKDGKYAVQTPQAFRADILKKAYSLKKEGEEFPDESSLVSKYCGKCRVVISSDENRKLTFKGDFPAAEVFAGTGFDLHLLAEGRKLILGGVEIPHSKGLLGHSDADVLIHAIMDALLSSASLPDIGRLFPDDDPKYEGADSALLLKEVLALLGEKGYTVRNVSAVIMAQKPKLAGYVDAIKENLATLLGTGTEKVGITCTTLEGIGTVGREEGIAVQAYCLTERR